MVSGGLHRMAETARKTSASIKGTNGALTQSYDQIRRKIDDLESSIRKSTSVKHIREARRELEQLNRVAAKHSGNTGGGFLSGALGSVRTLMPAMGLAGALMLGGSSFTKAMQNDSMSRAINFATGGQGTTAISSVKGLNNKYGLSDEAGLEGFKTLSGSVRSLNIPLTETLRIYESVGAASAAMGVDAEAQKGIFLALGQIASKGTVSAEELRGQIGERLPGAFGIAAKAMGKTEKQLGDMMKKGELLSKDFLPKFATELQNTFGAAAAQSAEGPMAVYNRFNNVLHELSITIGQYLLPPMTALMQIFISGVAFVKEYDYAFIALASGMAAYALVANGVTWATTLWTGAQKMLNLVMSMNPIGIVIIAIAGLVAGIMIAWNKFEGFRAVVLGLWEVFKTVFENIGTFFKQIFAPIGEAIAAFKDGRWMDMGAAVAKLALNISPVGLAANAIKFQREGGGFTKGVGDAWNRGKELAKRPGGATTPAGATLGSAMSSGGGTAAVGSDETTKGITGGGPRIININGVKFADKIEVHNTNSQENASELEQIFQEMFLRVLNSGAAVQ